MISVKKQFVITVAGTAGSGKSTLTQELERVIGDATTLKFDDYFGFLEGWPENIREWLDEGADFQDWNNTQLVSDINALLRGKHIIYPITKETVHPCKIIFVEDPSGRERDEMANLVNFVLYIDIPNDIAYMRALKRWINKEITQEDGKKVKKRDVAPKELLEEIVNYVQLYVDYYRDLYVTTCKKVKNNVDLIIDGTLPTQEQVKKVLQFLVEKKIVNKEEVE